MTDATSAVSPLRRRVIDDMTLRNLSPATQRSYTGLCCRSHRPPDDPSWRQQGRHGGQKSVWRRGGIATAGSGYSGW